MITFNIWGNCVSRDVLAKLEEKQSGKVLQFVGSMVSHPISAFSDKYERTITMDDLSKYNGNYFHKRAFCQDLNKTALSYLTFRKADYLVVDMIATVCDMYKKNNHYMVCSGLYDFNKEQIKSDFALKTEYELIRAHSIEMDVWRLYIEKFCDYISMHYTPNQIIFLECYKCNNYYDFDDNEMPIKSFPDAQVCFQKNNNVLLKELN